MPELITPVGKNSAFLLYNRLCACVCEYYKIGYFYEVRDANGLLGRNDNGRQRIIRANKVQSERNCGSRRTTSKLKQKNDAYGWEGEGSFATARRLLTSWKASETACRV